MPRKRDVRAPQAAAIAILKSKICLVPTRSGKGLIVPKGNVSRGDRPWQTALQEAWEEAGLMGDVCRRPLGEYEFRKNGQTQQVQVFLLMVTQVARYWPEKSFRRRVWLSIESAADRVSHPPLREFLESLVEDGRHDRRRAA